FRTRCEVREIPQVATIQRQILNVTRRDVETDVCLLSADQIGFTCGYGNTRRLHARFKSEIDVVCLSNQHFRVFNRDFTESARADLDVISASREEVDSVFSSVIRRRCSAETVRLVSYGYAGVTNCRLVFIFHHATYRGTGSDLREHVCG